jgi:DNA-binding CsgD family transcriptional regulator/sugar-specific transcriptional regulator TrmB
MLEELGISVEAEAVYRLLLTSSRRAVADIAEASGLSENSVQAQMGLLTELGLLRPGPEPGTVHAVGPEVGLAGLLAGREMALAAERTRVESARSNLELFVRECVEARTAQSRVEHLAGIDMVRGRLQELAASARFEMLNVVATRPSPGALEASKVSDGELLERGVSVRSLCLSSTANDKETMLYGRWLREHGGEIRTTAALPLRMVVVDRAIAMLPSNPEDSAQGADVHIGGSVVVALVALFESLWGQAAPIDDWQPRRIDLTADLVSDQHREVLALLAAGATDETVARKLDVSVRTARRIAAEIAAQLKARSRFQAGVEAARQNLV